MAGGTGERFWPVSRSKWPKQLLKLTHPDKSMLEEAIDRIAPLIPKENIFIVTSQQLVEAITNNCAGVPAHNIVAEPDKRNTSGCIALGNAVISARFSDTPPSEISCAILTADHVIKDEEGFRTTVDRALTHAETTGDLVTIGIRPDRPSTGFGYIETSQSTSPNSGAVQVVSFREKPDVTTARQFVASGRYLWNSGMFFWNLEAINKGLLQHLPDVGAQIAKMCDDILSAGATDTQSTMKSIHDNFLAMPNISIDYGLMERADNVAVVPSAFDWDDVGSWDALPRTRGVSDEGNVAIGACSLIDTQDSIVVNHTDNNDMMVAVVGMQDVVVVTTKDGILVCPKDRVQEVKKAVADIRNQSGETFL